MRPFAALAAGTCPPHEDMLLAVAAELGPYDATGVVERLDELAGKLPGPEVDPALQLRAVARLLERDTPVRQDGALLLPHVLRAGAGHPAGVVSAVAAACARRGLAIDVVGCGTDVWLAHPEAAPLVVDPVSASVVDGRTLGVDLSWRCAHELAHVTLSLVIETAERDGDIALALQAASLGTELPLDDSWPDGPVATLSRVRARLN